MKNKIHPFYKTGKDHPGYKHGGCINRGYNYRFTKLSIELLGKSCQHCGKRKNVETHYIDGNPRNNPEDGSNWMRLCRSCLTFISRRGYIPEDKEKALEENKEKNVKVASDRHKARAFKRNVPEGYFSTRQVEDRLGITRQRIHQLKYFFEVKFIGGRIVYTKESVEKYLAEKKVDGRTLRWRKQDDTQTAHQKA